MTYLVLSRKDRVQLELVDNHEAMDSCEVRGSEPSALNLSGLPAASPCVLPLS